MKKQTKINKLLALFAASIALVFLQAPQVYADRGLTISPGYIKVQFASNETQQDIAISVTNNFLQDIDIEVKPVDVDTANNTLAPLGSNTSIATKTVSVAKPLLHIGASKSVNIIAHINGLELPPGGQYTALLIHPLDPTNKQIPLQQAVSVGIFIAKQEGTVKKLVPTISLPKGLLVHKPKTIEVKLENSGNTELVPYASFLIKKGDEVVAKAIINEDSIPLFAGQASNYKKELSYVRGFLPDKYTVVFSYRYAGQDQPSVISSSFWYVPAQAIVLIVIIAAFWLWYFRKKIVFYTAKVYKRLRRTP